MSSVIHVIIPPLVFFLLLLLLQPAYIVAQSYRNVSLGSSLTANGDDTSWRSPSGDFAFGFRPLENNLFVLAIWFDKIPEKTIVWYAEVDESIPRGSKVELTSDGRLVLNVPQGKELWEAAPANVAVIYAAMLDNGNFILASRDSSVNLWESFKQPRDTILPTQTMEVDSVLYSRKTENSFSRGRFRLRLLQDGNLVLNIVAFPSLFEVQYDAYYWSHTVDINQTKAGYKVVFNESGSIYVMRRNGDNKILSEQNIDPDHDLYYRATLDFDGVFTKYSHPRTSSGKNSSWSNVWSVPDNICTGIIGDLGSGACGYNSYCTLTQERRPNCKCPPEYSPVDSNNSFGGCKPNSIQGCQGEEWKNPEDNFELQSLKDIDWPTSDYEKLELYREQDCRNACLSDCLCAVAIFRTGTCWKKKLPLSNGRYNSPSIGSSALIKLRKGSISTPQYPSSTIPSSKKDRSKLILVVSVLLGSSVLVNLLTLARSCLFFFNDYKKGKKINQESSVLISNLRAFSYKELEEATGGFKEELGKGAFGVVYKGVTEEMGLRNYIAVKMLDKVVQEGEKEFKTEVSVIGRTHHKNLVQLLGFCNEGQHRLLVYEFMSNGNLAKLLFRIPKPDWNQRIQIATCIARGLMYLHEECNPQIIHCDIKPQNILLDESFTARISDFGLAKLLMNDETRTRTGIRGTRGYVAPEWFRNIAVTVKVDVYSFGVMLLEIISCRRSVELQLGEGERAILTEWAYDCYREGKHRDLVENDDGALNDMSRMERLVMIAIWCIQEEPSLRPSMKKVTQMLEGGLEVSVPPCPYSCSKISFRK